MACGAHPDPFLRLGLYYEDIQKEKRRRIMNLLPVFYLPPVSWFARFIAQEDITLEQYENFPKQT